MDKKVKLIVFITIILMLYYAPVCAENINIPEDTLEFNGHTYKFYAESIDWHSAKERCNKYGGHLVTITSKEENDFLINNLPKSNKSFFWIGATDEEQEGVWQWVTSESFSYDNWSEDSPNNSADKEHYAGFISKEENYDGYLTPIGSWNDFQVAIIGDCGYICEWDFIKNDDNNIKEESAIQNSNELDNKSKDGINITFHIDNLSLIGGLSIFGGISFIGFILKKNKKDG